MGVKSDYPENTIERRKYRSFGAALLHVKYEDNGDKKVLCVKAKSSPLFSRARTYLINAINRLIVWA